MNILRGNPTARTAALVLAGALLVASCGGEDTDDTSTDAPTATEAEVTTTEAETTTTEAEVTTTEAETTTTEADDDAVVDDDASAGSDPSVDVIATGDDLEYCQAKVNAEAAADSMIDFSTEGTLAMFDDQLDRMSAVSVPAAIADDFGVVSTGLQELRDIVAERQLTFVAFLDDPEILAIIEAPEYTAAEENISNWETTNCVGVEPTEVFDESDPADVAASLFETEEGRELMVEQMMLLGLTPEDAECFVNELDPSVLELMAQADPTAGADGMDPALIGPLFAALETCEIPLTSLMAAIGS